MSPPFPPAPARTAIPPIAPPIPAPMSPIGINHLKSYMLAWYRFDWLSEKSIGTSHSDIEKGSVYLSPSGFFPGLFKIVSCPLERCKPLPLQLRQLRFPFLHDGYFAVEVAVEIQGQARRPERLAGRAEPLHLAEDVL